MAGKGLRVAESPYQPPGQEAQGQHREGAPERPQPSQPQGMDFPTTGCHCPFITRITQWGSSQNASPTSLIGESVCIFHSGGAASQLLPCGQRVRHPLLPVGGSGGGLPLPQTSGGHHSVIHCFVPPGCLGRNDWTPGFYSLSEPDAGY